MLANDIQKVYLVNIPKNFAKNENGDTSLQNQIIHTSYPPSAFFSVDTEKSENGTDDYAEIITPVTIEKYNTFTLKSVEIRMNIPTINQFNNQLRIIYTDTVTDIEAVATFNLVEGYYKNIDEFVTMLNVVFAEWQIANAGIFNTQLQASRASILTNSLDFLRIGILFPQFAIPTNTVIFQMDSNSSYVKYSKWLCYFDTSYVIQQNNSILSNFATFIYTRYLEIQCAELTNRQRVQSYDGKKISNDLIASINVGKLVAPIHTFIPDNSEFTLDTKGADLSRIILRIEDEYGNAWPVGYSNNGIFLDNQVRLVFLCTD